MMQNQQNIGLSEASEDDPSLPSPDDPDNPPPPAQPSEDSHLFHSIEKYLQQHCCIKFILFLVVILLVVAIYQEKGYLIKKQRTFNFFIDKIQKEKIKKQLISETQEGLVGVENTGPVAKEETIPQPQQKKIEAVGRGQESKQDEEKQKIQSTYPPQIPQSDQYQQKYPSIQGISMSKIVQSSRWRNLKNEDLLMHSQLAKEEQEYYEQIYNISQYKELPFCVVVPTFNNLDGHRHLSNIQSIVMQDYQNYHIVVIDDASTDGTGNQIKEYLNKQTKIKTEHYKIIQNKENVGSSRNIRKAAQEECGPEEIFVIVDGDDELVGRQVLKLYNAVYQQSGAWIVYSNFFTEQGKLGYSKPFPPRVIKENAYRKYPFVTSHLRSMYTALVRQIKQQDLKDSEGKFLTVANDVATVIPCLEMAHNRVIYIPQLTYMYSQRTGLNNHQLRLTQQKRNERSIRKKSPYSPLASISSAINSEDKLFDKANGHRWFAYALLIQRKTEDLGTVSDRILPTAN